MTVSRARFHEGSSPSIVNNVHEIRPGRERFTISTRRRCEHVTKAKKPKKKKQAIEKPAQPSGRLGAEQWLAVRLKTGAGPMEPKARRGTRAERERAALELENRGADGKDV